MKKTLVLGASTNKARYSYIATQRLNNHGIDIQQGTPNVEGVDTVTLYLNPQRQEAYYDYILGLKPKRIIFNPGTENPTLMRLAREQGIEPEAACTLVLLSTGQY